MSVASPPVLMGADDLEETAIGRRIEKLAESIDKKNSLPPWALPVTLYLIAQLIGGVWWGATMQAKMDFLTAQNIELRAKNDVQDLLINKAENGLDERIRAKAREVLADWGYIHVPQKGQP